MAKDHGSSVKNDKQYEGLRKKGMSKSRAAAIANDRGLVQEGRQGVGQRQDEVELQPGRHEGAEGRRGPQGRQEEQLEQLGRRAARWPSGNGGLHGVVRGTL